MAHKLVKTRELGEVKGGEYMNLGLLRSAFADACVFEDSMKKFYVFPEVPMYTERELLGSKEEQENARTKGGLVYSSVVLKTGGAFRSKLQQRYLF